MPEFAERPAIADAPISAIIPIHNPGAGFPQVIHAWLHCLELLKRDYELLIVDQGSTDGSAATSAGIAAGQPRMRVLSMTDPPGFGAGLRSGLAAAQYPLVFYTACDRQYRPGEFKELLKAINEVDLVSGYRIWQPVPPWLRTIGRIYGLAVRLLFGIAPEPLPGWLNWSSHAYARLVRWLFGVRIRDIDSCFKLFRRDIFTRIPIQSNGSFVHAEILAKANFIGCMMTEVPVPCRPPVASELPAESSRHKLAEGWKVLCHPDFGPPPPVPAANPPDPLPSPPSGV